MIGTPALPAAGVSMRIVVLKMAFPRVRKAAGASLSAARWAWRFPSSFCGDVVRRSAAGGKDVVGLCTPGSELTLTRTGYFSHDLARQMNGCICVQRWH
jgi:hypothetical protein